ncbi:MAG: hypothetical protein JXK07_09950 [Spirochaetes bacterium]|nr:hypothetical protein [Spirochaetota bacterium]MBN2771280.1 hypothetical protein [Spirochaetota bacterium]
MNNIIDWKTDDNFDLNFETGNGDFIDCSDEECFIQDLHEAFHYPFFDDPDNPTGGNNIHKYVNSDESDKIAWIELKNEIKRVVRNVNQPYSLIDEKKIEVKKDGADVYADLLFLNGKTKRIYT